MNDSEKLLNDREQRVNKQNELQTKYQKTLIVIKANYPSHNKITNLCNYLVTKLFYEIKKNISLITYQADLSNEGLIFYLICEDDLLSAKLKMIELENTALGRLVDIDVYFNHKSISREDLNYPARLCYLCQEKARICTRMQRHALDDVIAYFNKQVLADIFSKNIYSNLALYGLINELLKPIGFGTVTIDNQGSHHDMNYKTFIDSIETIAHKFNDFRYINHKNFVDLRKFGLEVEQDMFKTTANINTHKGVVFSLILVLAGVASSKSYENISQKIKELTKDIYDDFSNKQLKDTHGQRIYDKYQIKGIRKEAYEGYQSVFEVFEPYYQQTKDTTKTFLKIIAYLDDTTIIKRSSFEMLNKVKKEASEIIDCEDEHQAFNEYLISNNISCGGSADLLSIVLILNLIKENRY